MTQEEKQLLMKDLCARLPYHTKCYNINTEEDFELSDVTDIDTGYPSFDYGYAKIEDVKPYLRPMSDMTKEERSDFGWIAYEDCEYDNNDNPIHTGSWVVNFDYIDDMIDFLNSHHFDYGGLIEKGLAIEATTDMYNN